MNQNPFLIYGYLSPEYFCNREKEFAALTSAIENNRNATLQSMRRLGKTSLLHHLFNHLKSNKSYRTLYIDLQFTAELKDFLELLANSVYENLFSKQEKMLKDFVSIFRSIKPSMTFDAKNGTAAIELGLKNEHQSRLTIDDIFNFLKEYSKKYNIVIAFDEFQQITGYPEKNVEALLRSKIQDLPQTRFIFSGSKKHLMTEMFFSAKRPFYQSTELMTLQKLQKEEFIKFIKDRFATGKKEISEESAGYILSKCYTYTYYVQFLCNRLFSRSDKKINDEIIESELNDILNENESTYYSYKNLLTAYNWKLLKAIAKEGGASKPTGGDFIKKYDLKASSSVRTAIKSLLDKEFLYKEQDSYFVYDVFFGRWLEKEKF